MDLTKLTPEERSAFSAIVEKASGKPLAESVAETGPLAMAIGRMEQGADVATASAGLTQDSYLDPLSDAPSAVEINFMNKIHEKYRVGIATDEEISLYRTIKARDEASTEAVKQFIKKEGL